MNKAFVTFMEWIPESFKNGWTRMIHIDMENLGNNIEQRTQAAERHDF